MTDEREKSSLRIGSGPGLPDELGLILALAGQRKIDFDDILILDCVQQGMWLREVARVLDIPVTTVRNRLARLRRVAEIVADLRMCSSPH